ncbi:MAG TPA: universal stress protein [Candidatus Nitrosotalea sp.]|nr:universal stress protein [Candidatus Nitrosotalea sp.]
MVKLKIRKILVPLDGSKSSLRGLDHAIYLARQCNAIITGVHVISIYPTNLADLVNPIKARLFKYAEELMDRSEITCAQKGIVFRKRILYGDPKSEISDFIKQNRFDLVVIGARGLGPVKEVVLGSVSNAVLHRSKIPVLVAK